MALDKAYSSICPHLSLIDGSTADTLLPITGMEVGDVIDSVTHISTKADFTTETPVDISSVTVVAGGIEVDFATASDQLRVFWLDTSA